MLVPDVEGSYLLIFRERCLPVHVAVARQHEDCIYIFQPKCLGEPAIYRNRIGHCAIVPQCRVMLPSTLHPHRKIEQTATPSVGDAACSDDRHSTFGNPERKLRWLGTQQASISRMWPAGCAGSFQNRQARQESENTAGRWPRRVSTRGAHRLSLPRFSAQAVD